MNLPFILIPQAKKGNKLKTPSTIKFQEFTALFIIHLSE